MGYKIQYGKGNACRQKINAQKEKRVAYILLAVIVLCVIIYAFAGPIDLRKLLIPGNESVTEAAAFQLTENLRSGQPFTEAFSSFCIEILTNGQ